MTTIRRATALAALLLAGPAGCYTPAPPPPIFLGHVANLSGADRSGAHAEQGIRLALNVLAGDKFSESLEGRELKVRHTDTRGLLDASESEAVRLAGINRVVGLIGGATADEVARLDRAHVPIVATAGLRPPGASDMVFAAGMRPSQQAFVLAKYAAVELDLSEVVVLADDRREEFLALADDFCRHFAVERKAKAKGSATPPVPVRYGKDPNWEDLARTIAARKSARAVVFAGKARDWVELRRKLSASPPLIFAGDDGDAANLHGAPGKQLVYLATAFAPDKGLPRTQAFIQKYRDAFKEEPDVAAALGYESVLIFAEALKQVGPNLTPEKLQSALHDIKDVAGLAGTLTMTKEQYVSRPLYAARFDGTTLTSLKRYEADTLP
jgi:branched-chain amino acid transport system substrate-binding protein